MTFESNREFLNKNVDSFIGKDMDILLVNNVESKFNFPFEPYDIQVELMKIAYQAFKDKKFAILESPTGTGKSMSLICSSLTWLTDNQSLREKILNHQRDVCLQKIDKLKKQEEESGDWLSTQTKVRDVNKQLEIVDHELCTLNKFKEMTQARLHAKLHNLEIEYYSVLKKESSTNNKITRNDSHLSDAGSQIIVSQSTQSSQNNFDELNEDDIEKKLKAEEQDQVLPKIYYASRTHSQLSQFINELKKTKFSSNQDDQLPIKLVPLASRANLCVNPEVLKLKDPSAINEKCVEMQRETTADKRCPFIKTKQVHLLKEEILTAVHDIEDMVSRGRTLGSCPYYASRMSIPEAEVVVVPYNNLLHHETRAASSLNLKNSVVIIDEAHNILETICSIHSVSIKGQHLIGAHMLLSRYYSRYHNRFSPKNAVIIKTIVQLLTDMIRFLNNPEQHLLEFDKPKVINEVCNNENQDQNIKKSKYFQVEVPKFLGASNCDKYNVFKIVDYFNRSQLARKLLGFFRQQEKIDLTLDVEKISEKTAGGEENPARGPIVKRRKVDQKKPEVKISGEKDSVKPNSCSLVFLDKTNIKLDLSSNSSYPMFTLLEFLKSLTNLSEDGKILIEFVRGDILKSELKFILLNASSQFREMAKDARSIVLAGGTMQPFDEFKNLLFKPLSIHSDRLITFTCGHVIEPNQLFVGSLSHGSSNKQLELSYKTKTDNDVIDEYGRTIMNIATMVPSGMICFMPSYDYEQLCHTRWTQTGLITNIETKSKQVFREPRQSSHVKPILDEFSRIVEKTRNSNRGALLFCVVGGKMSEGINFNDDLGRCIVMIGLPYANIKSPELRQKMSFYDKNCPKSSGAAQGSPSPGQQYYDNLCIKGINQSIGRAIRHKRDYAAIILLDRRYSSKTTIRNSLPGWMKGSLVDYDKFGHMFCKLRHFFSNLDKKFTSQSL